MNVPLHHVKTVELASIDTTTTFAYVQMVIMGKIARLVSVTLKSVTNECFRPFPHESRNFQYLKMLKPQNFTCIHVNLGLKRSGERFQNNAVSVTGFTGFVWMEGRFG